MTACRSDDFEALYRVCVRSARRLHPYAMTSPRKPQASGRRRHQSRSGGERRRSKQLRWRCACLRTSRFGRGGAAPRWQDHEQRFEERAPVAGSVLGRRCARLAVGIAIVVKQLSRETGRLLRGDTSVSRGCRAAEDCRQTKERCPLSCPSLSPLCRARKDRPARRLVTSVARPRRLSHRDMLLGPGYHRGTIARASERMWR